MDINVKEYLSSGILELYVSGALPEDEAQEVRLLSHKHPEILAEIEAIEASIMAYAASFVRKERKLPILKVDQLEPKILSTDSPSNITESLVQNSTGDKEAVIKRFDWRIFAVAASVMLLASVMLNLYFFQQWQNSEQEVIALNSQSGQFTQDIEVLETRLEKTLGFINSPDYRRVAMKNANPKSSEDLLTYVHWNPSSEEIYIQVVNLPEINSETSQYQLWAIKAGQDPISMGVFDMSDSLQLQSEKIGGDVIMFAVTEEPKGGSQVPTLEKMTVAGEVS